MNHVHEFTTRQLEHRFVLFKRYGFVQGCHLLWLSLLLPLLLLLLPDLHQAFVRIMPDWYQTCRMPQLCQHHVRLMPELPCRMVVHLEAFVHYFLFSLFVLALSLVHTLFLVVFTAYPWLFIGLDLFSLCSLILLLVLLAFTSNLYCNQQKHTINADKTPSKVKLLFPP